MNLWREALKAEKFDKVISFMNLLTGNIACFYLLFGLSIYLTFLHVG